MIPRPTYIERPRQAEPLPLLPILTGIRRCGKSSILELYADDLVARGNDPSSILKINMESLEFDDLREYRAMARFVAQRLPDGGILLLDEAQEVASWERLAASLLAERKVRCVLTGSNAALLSSELGRLLTGRVIEIPIETRSGTPTHSVAFWRLRTITWAAAAIGISGYDRELPHLSVRVVPAASGTPDGHQGRPAP